MSKPDVSKRRICSLAACIAAVVAVALLVLSPISHRAAHASSPSSATSRSASQSTITPAARERLQATFAALPLAFEQNQGQTDPQVKYMARANGYKLYLTSSEAVFTLHKQGGDSEVRRMMMDRRIGPAAVKRMLQRRAGQKSTALAATVRMQLLGANPGVELAASDPQGGKVNYFIGNDPAKWRSNVPLFGQVSYRKIYPGIDLAFHGAGRQLEFDYLVAPGADAGSIALAFQGADKMSTNPAGDLVLTTAAGPVEIHRPVAYQQSNGARQKVDARFVMKKANEVAFAVGSYDHSRQLVIDPTVTYSTYFGGSSADYGLAIAVDGSGNEFVAGATDSSSIPGWTTAPVGGFDVFVTKISSAGALLFTTEFGGSSDDFPGGIAVDSTGIYVSGTTDSSDFPVTTGAAQTTFVGGGANGNNDAFAAKLALTGSSITWATYINGSDSTSGLAVAADTSQNVYVVGETFAPDLGGGVVNALPNGSAINLNSGSGDDDGYIVKVNSTGTAFLLVSYIGGSSGDLATGVALDGSGNIYVSGETISTDLPVVNALQSKCGTDGTCNTGASGPLDDALVAAIQANLSGYTYLTYYGGSGVDDALAITADSAGDAFITGLTQSSDLVLTTPYQPSLAGTQNAFVVEINPTGSAATYGTYLGGSGTDLGLGIALDSSSPANIYVTGQTSSATLFPLVNPTQPALSGPTDAFVTVLSPSQSTALFSTYLGGGGDEDQLSGAIALDATERIYVTGDTDSGNGTTTAFPTTSALDGTYGGAGSCTNTGGTKVPCPDAFIASYSAATVPDFTIAAGALSPSATVSPGSSATSKITITALNAYSNTINLTCSVSGGGTPAPTCALNGTSTTGSGTSTLTVSTTGSSAAVVRPSKFFYAMWLPIAGMALVGMGFSSARTRRKKLLGFLMIGMVMAALFLM
ncbi:MAG: SBBP repeat-containing protein, partial [Candidatus Sulfotelmatobacter sp.]